MKSKLEEERERLTSSEGFQAGYRVTLPPPARDGGSDCEICRGIGRYRVILPPHDPDFGKLTPCECQVAEFAAKRQARLDAACNMTPGEMALSLDDFVSRGKGSMTDEMIRRVRHFAERPTGIATFHGGWGNGKSLALMGLTNHFRNQGKMSVYVTLVDLVEWVRAGHAKGADRNAEQRYQLVMSAYFLAIDETGKVEHQTDWYKTLLFRAIDRRYRDALERISHTVFALNDDPRDTLPGHIVSRLRDTSFSVEIDQETGLGKEAIYYNGDTDMRPAKPVPQEQLL